MLVLEWISLLVVLYFIIGLVFFAWNLLNYTIGINDQEGYARKTVKSFRWPILVKEFVTNLAEDASR